VGGTGARPPGLVRNDPFDGRKPTDWVAPGGTWPEGPFVSLLQRSVDQKLTGFARQQAELAARAGDDAVMELAAEVLELLRWRKLRRLSAQQLARRAGVSRDRLAVLEKGEQRFPKWDLVPRLHSARKRYEAEREQRLRDAENRG
jgi:DNA-binding XRE family transcriptional regulator